MSDRSKRCLSVRINAPPTHASLSRTRRRAGTAGYRSPVTPVNNVQSGSSATSAQPCRCHADGRGGCTTALYAVDAKAEGEGFCVGLGLPSAQGNIGGNRSAIVWPLGVLRPGRLGRGGARGSPTMCQRKADRSCNEPGAGWAFEATALSAASEGGGAGGIFPLGGVVRQPLRGPHSRWKPTWRK